MLSSIIGNNYKLVNKQGETFALERDQEPDDISSEESVEQEEEGFEDVDQAPAKKTMDDYVFQFYLGSLTVVGLFILFRMIQKSR